MGRVVAIIAAILIVAMLLWSALARDRASYAAQIRAEHSANVAWWGEAEALRALEGALDQFPPAKPVAQPAARPVPAPAQGPNQPALAEIGRATAELERTKHMLTAGNDVAASLEGLALLVTYRSGFLLYSVPAVLAILGAALADGIATRAIKGRTFGRYDPEVVSVAAAGTLILSTVLILAILCPFTLHPLVLPLLGVVLAPPLHAAVANYRS